ncbi:hypothetical protein L5515_018187 [Caenorhabditis briggsae]|uniref:Uncharacterized protein n=1 Tax=Caenorhabditis briggsae TaxID=6238 RepID=A0AAE9FBN6_CAEBR|nr:hypothetical protein L5515_018187 [Caenorhabditis briggsae]
MEMNRPWKPTNVDIVAVDPRLYYRYRYPDNAMIHTPPAERHAAQNNAHVANNIADQPVEVPVVEQEEIADEPLENNPGDGAANEPPVVQNSQRRYWFCTIL